MFKPIDARGTLTWPWRGRAEGVIPLPLWEQDVQVRPYSLRGILVLERGADKGVPPPPSPTQGMPRPGSQRGGRGVTAGHPADTGGAGPLPCRNMMCRYAYMPTLGDRLSGPSWKEGGDGAMIYEGRWVIKRKE